MFRHYRVILRELVTVPCQVTQVFQMQLLLKTYVKRLNCKLYYQQLHLKYLCNLARYCYKLPEDDTIVSKHVGM